MARDVVIVGAGPAGMNALDTIRSVGDGADITLVCDEPPYSRMALPYFMAGDVAERHLMTADDAYLDRLGVRPVIGDRVASIDTQARQVILDSGEELDYDALLLATGASAVKAPIPGVDAPDVHNLWTLDDAKAVLARLPEREVVVIGGGFIGLTCLDALAKHASRVTVIELEDRILPRMVDEAAARLAEDRLRARGIEVLTGTEVEAVEGTGRKTVATRDGREIACDVVVTATGIRPNVGFLAGTGIGVEEGIIVDERLRTTVPGVWAAGDCAQGPDLVDGGRAVHAIQPTATDHGRVAGAAIAGVDVAYPGSIAINVLEVQDYSVASFGHWSADGDTTTVANPSRGLYRKLVWRDRRLVGAILAGLTKEVGLVNDLGMVKGLIQSGADLGEWKDYLHENPLDLRRAYVGAGVAPALLRQRLLDRPSTGAGYRYPTDEPARWPAHDVFVRTKPGT